MRQMERVRSRILTGSLLLCAALYAEETVHFLQYGWNSPDNRPFTRDMSSCRPVPGKAGDVECPVEGYGWARYRYRFADRRDPRHNEIDFVDRTQ